ncbi:MAG: sugar phosphate isomerase/epimerase [Verrucomicrobiae bacterium]|nr:sugar phosphate isomerase/epimerase [Verrucomicrobiae bacterium]NNJ41732.1 sugar phosphate isomerase/epimerase [Akkermansiaceae bacterium]
MKFGNECYTWFMKESGGYWDNQLAHMIEVTAKAGMSGIEPMHFWMGDLSNPDRLGDCLKENGIDLAAIALVLDWNNPEESEEEIQQAEQTINLLKRFPGALLCTVQMPNGRHNLEQRRKNLVANVNTVSRRAVDAGVPCSFHPNSPESSINRTEEDYSVIIDGLDSSVTGWTPDVGHIINGKMDPLTKMKQYADLINHVHYKDWDGKPEFALMGDGEVDFQGITQWLSDQHYDGWIICEDEAPQAVDDPDGVTLHDGKWIKDTLIPSITTNYNQKQC